MNKKNCSLHSVLLFSLISQKKSRFSPSPQQIFAAQIKTVFFKNLYPIEIEMVTYNNQYLHLSRLIPFIPHT